MDPREFSTALDMWFEFQRGKARERFEVARFEAWLIVNPTLKKKLHKPSEMIQFEWERKVGWNDERKQSPEEMKRIAYAMATHVRDPKTGKIISKKEYEKHGR